MSTENENLINMNLNNLDDDGLIEKLRFENFNQFDTLVRMHLSFIMDLNTYDPEEPVAEKDKSKKRKLVSFTKKVKNVKGIMDGMPLTQEGICQVYQLVEFLRKDENIKVEGIFRRTGSLLRQQELKSLLNRGSALGLENNTYTVHDCASVLKGFLAELPEPLLTTAHYTAHCQVADLYCAHKNAADQQKIIYTIQLLLLLLPSENRILLKDILDLLHVVASHESDNKMSAENLATVFTPHLVCPRNLTPQALHENLAKLTKIVSFMITKSKDIFQVPPKLAVDVRAYYSERERRKQLCPKRNFDESVSDNVAANTVFSFVDVERTAKENQSNPTETALAELYAHIQSLPESSKKRRLVKQFNKENGHGTPLQRLQNDDHESKGLSSIKKYVLENNMRKGVRNKFSQLQSTGEELNESMMTPRSRKPVLVVSGTNIHNLPKLDMQDCTIESIKEELSSFESSSNLIPNKSKNLENLQQNDSDPLSNTFREYLRTRSILTATPTDLSFTSSPDDYCSTGLNSTEMSSSLLHCLNGYTPPEPSSPMQEGDCGETVNDNSGDEKELVLRPKQFDDNGKPIIYETSF